MRSASTYHGPEKGDMILLGPGFPFRLVGGHGQCRPHFLTNPVAFHVLVRELEPNRQIRPGFREVLVQNVLQRG